jgi:F-type H+-transporting ATPase subunit gamma
MANLKELRNRITSVTSTQKITRAMQMVAASKLRRAQEAVEATRPYSDKLSTVVGNLSKEMDGDDNAPELLVGNGNSERYLFVVATSERGLCGGFNSSITRLASKSARSLIKQGKDVKFICVGKKGKAALSREFGESIIEFFDFSDVRNLGFTEGDSIAKKIISLFNEDSFDVCQLYYSKFESVLTQIPTEQTIIPFGLSNESNEDIVAQEACYEYEPDEVDILKDLLPKNLSIQVFRALLENFASEQGARMSAMDNATRNANEMIDKLKITYNRSRQATITSELIEIISGAEAL